MRPKTENRGISTGGHVYNLSRNEHIISTVPGIKYEKLK